MLWAVYFVKICSDIISFIPKGQNSPYKLLTLKVLKVLSAKLVNLSSWGLQIENPLDLKYILWQIMVNSRQKKYIGFPLTLK